MGDLDNVVVLDGCSLTPRERNERLVGALEDALELARSGGLVSFVGGGQCSDGEVYSVAVSNSATQTFDLGVLQRLSFRVAAHIELE